MVTEETLYVSALASVCDWYELEIEGGVKAAETVRSGDSTYLTTFT